ncbi:MAG TPA: response regulator transcription factor, partial [Dehalococcoidia bacterium]|nr:response regulator transcription factor [Dehalococcoidia bacterium]
PLACLADVCVALGDRPRAAVLYELLLPSAGTLTVHVFVAVCEGAVDRRLGLLAGLLERWDAAAVHFEAALRLHEQVGARVWLAQTQREYAELLLRRPSRTPQAVDRAHSLLQAALASYEAMDIEYEAQRTQALLAELEPRAPAARRFPAGLSEREVEVLRLVAAGRTNREIAEALVVSPATVAFHLKSILNKTGAANRTEAATFAHRHGLTVPPA